MFVMCGAGADLEIREGYFFFGGGYLRAKRAGNFCLATPTFICPHPFN